MHMNSAPHLLAEDRPEFERILDEALRTAHERPELSGIGDRLNAVQLRTMVLAAGTFITERASAEYEHYVEAREQRRTRRHEGAAADASVLASAGEALEPSGAGIGAVVTVLAPVLAGTAAAIFLLVGYILKMLNPVPAFADTMLTAGWFFGALTAAAILAAAVGLLLTALRNGATQVVAVDEDERGGRPRRAHPGSRPRPRGLASRPAGTRHLPVPARRARRPERRPHGPGPRAARSAASPPSATTARASTAPTTAPPPPAIPASPARTSPAPTSAARSTSRTEQPDVGLRFT